MKADFPWYATKLIVLANAKVPAPFTSTSSKQETIFLVFSFFDIDHINSVESVGSRNEAMAYLLEFPPSMLPADIRTPPYVIFAIMGTSVTQHLPQRIPLSMVLHFAPKLAQWVLPAPENLPPAVAQGTLRTPYVGIDIRLDIGPASLQRIMSKMMQTAGFAVPKTLFQHKPSLTTSISIRRTWQMLELAPAGLDALLIHIQTTLMTGSPVTVTFTEMRELWEHFPAAHVILRLAAINFVQAHIELFYSRDEFVAIRKWYTSDVERHAVFKVAEDQFPAFGKTRTNSFPFRSRINSNATESKRKAREKEKQEMATEQEAIAKRMEALEKRNAIKGPRKMSMDDMKKNKSHQTVRKSMKVSRSMPDFADEEKFEMGVMNALLDDALRKVQEKREAEDAADDEKEKLASASKDDCAAEGELMDAKVGDEKMEMLQPAVYNGSESPTDAALQAADIGA